MPTSSAGRSDLPGFVQRLFRQLQTYVQAISWRVVLGLGAVHYVVSWVALRLVGEDDLLALSVFWYFYWTTATTVGYGDLSPSLPAGRFVVTTFVMPGGIALFTTVIAKAAQNFADTWRKRMKGLADYSHMADHIVILGWAGYRSLRLREMLLADSREQRQLVLVADIEENPVPGGLEFVRTGTLSDSAALVRAGVATASVIIVFTETDGETLSAALAAGALNRKAHLVAFFMERSAAEILQPHCPNAECVVSMSVENTVRASQDPGSSRVVNTLLSPDGQTQYMLSVPRGVAAMTVEGLLVTFKRLYDATLLGLHNEEDGLQLNPPLAAVVQPGDELYLMAAGGLRSSDVDWNLLAESAQPATAQG